MEGAAIQKVTRLKIETPTAIETPKDDKEVGNGRINE